MAIKSSIFHTESYKFIEKAIIQFLNSQPNFMSIATAQSPRAVGDAIQHVLSEQFDSLLGDISIDYSPSFARRAMADLAFTDRDELHYIVDVKTHRLDTAFNIPNITSVRRLIRLYEDDTNYFLILMVKYNLSQTQLNVDQVHFVPIEFLNWNCLTTGALGWGQIQIANTNRINISPAQSRKQWMLDLCEAMLAFYPREIIKINDRFSYIEGVKRFWEARQ